jgi:parvulin-like peptidyl-prolyl isomerase
MPLQRKIPRALALLMLILAACGPVLDTPAPTEGPALGATAASQDPTPQPDNPQPTPTTERLLAAAVNGQPICLEDYERQVALYEAAMLARGEDPSSPEGQEKLAQARTQILNWMIEQVLIEQAAAELGILVSDEDVDAELAHTIESGGGEDAFQTWLDQNGLTPEEAWREIRAGLIGMAVTEQVIATVPDRGEQVHARHILVDTQEEAERLLAQLEAGEDFSALARTYSQDENTREQGGDLGFFPRGVLMAPEVEEAAFGLQPGQVSGVIPSAFGFHIVKVIEREPDRPFSEESLRFLRDQALSSWKEALWAEARIERFVGQGP